jgi:hypothetical protein
MSGEERAALRNALKTAASVLKAGGIPFALAGSYALWVRGAPESEHDVDFAVAEEHIEKAAAILSEAGLPIVRPPEDWLIKTEVGGVLVDVLHRQAGVPVTSELLDRAEIIEVLSIRMPVLATTDLIASKLQVLSEHYCDFGAVLPSVRAVREQLDWPALRTAAEGNPFAEAFLDLCERLEIAPPATAPASRG